MLPRKAVGRVALAPRPETLVREFISFFVAPRSLLPPCGCSRLPRGETEEPCGVVVTALAETQHDSAAAQVPRQPDGTTLGVRMSCLRMQIITV